MTADHPAPQRARVPRGESPSLRQPTTHLVSGLPLGLESQENITFPQDSVLSACASHDSLCCLEIPFVFVHVHDGAKVGLQL